MCVVSMVGDHYGDQWRPRYPTYPAYPNTPTFPEPGSTQQEFDELKRQVEEMKELLKRAKRYDEEHGEPDCEIDEKMEFLRGVAALVGVDLDEVFGREE